MDGHGAFLEGGTGEGYEAKLGIGEAFRKRVELGLDFFVDMVVMRAFLGIYWCIHTILTRHMHFT